MSCMLLQLQTFINEQASLPWLKAGLLFVLGAVFGLLENLTPAREALLCLLASDFALGLARALKENVFHFRRFWRGARKFFLYALAIRVMLWVDVAAGSITLPVIGTISFNAALCGWMALGEGLSCLKHLDYFGLRLPWLSARLRRYQGMIETGEYRGPERRQGFLQPEHAPQTEAESEGRIFYDR